MAAFFARHRHQLTAGFGDRLQFSKGEFDLVILTFVSGMFSTPRLEEALRVLKPGGRVIMVGELHDLNWGFLKSPPMRFKVLPNTGLILNGFDTRFSDLVRIEMVKR